MTCPDCGHENIDGVDACDHCGQDLRSIDIPAPREGLQRTIMETPLRELGPTPALTVDVQDPVSRVIRQMQERRLGSAFVLDNDRLVGIFTERDVLNRLAGQKHDLDRLRVSQVMTRDPKPLSEDDTLAFALNRMAVGNYRHIPILKEGEPLRFISVRGVLRYLHENAN
ncbi:MAG: CBS domain-containing protein [Acidobacteriota bacterium]